jgi:hypothetical protein
MGPRRKPGRARTLGVLALLAFIGVPLALGEHHHASLDPARDCATCVVVHHSPAEGATPVVLPAPLLSRPLAVPTEALAVLSVERPAPSSRGPPVPVVL